jgi:UV DNA damage endonuclease
MTQQRIGFCCIALAHDEYIGTKFKSTTLSWCNKNKSQAAQKLVDIYKNNLEELKKVLNYCIDKKIWIYRISSDLFPLGDHPDYCDIYNNFYSNDSHWHSARIAVEKYYEMGGRCSTHPGQFCSIGSSNPSVVQNSISNLKHHADFMDKLGLPQNHSAHINIHLSNGKNPIDLLPIFKDSISKLPINVLSRLTFENEHSGFWTVSNIRSYFPNVPVVFDSLHYICNPDSLLSFEDAFKSALLSWKEAKPVFHHSEGKTKRDDRSHSDYIKQIPPIFNIHNVDIEVEAKAKNLAIFEYKKSLKDV